MFSERRTHPGDANASAIAVAPSSPTPQFSRLNVPIDPSATSAATDRAPSHPSDGLSPRSRSSGGARHSSSTPRSSSTPFPPGLSRPSAVAGPRGVSPGSPPSPAAMASASAAASSPSRPHDASTRRRRVSSSPSCPPPRPLKPPSAPNCFAMSVNESAEPDLTSAAALLRMRAIASNSCTFSTAPSWAARTSRRRTRTTGHASCWMRARHTPLDLTSTASLRNLDPAADIAACTCFGVQYPRSPSAEQKAWSSFRLSRLSLTRETSAEREIPASPGTFRTLILPLAAPTAAVTFSLFTCASGGHCRVSFGIRGKFLKSAPRRVPERGGSAGQGLCAP